MLHCEIHAIEETGRKNGYICHGSVRGWCGHIHNTWEAAEKCIDRDQAGCKMQGGYSDRGIMVIEDGELRNATEEDVPRWR